MPYSTVILGLAGLIPFVLIPLAYIGNWQPISESAWYFTAYSAVLLSFFGGIYWWDAISKQDYGTKMYIGMLPTIIGWLCLVFAGDIKVLGVLSATYVAVLFYDKHALSLPKAQIVSYISLRMLLTSVVVITHAWMILLITG